jgi:phosphonoacetaldehyde hydrolase
MLSWAGCGDINRNTAASLWTYHLTPDFDFLMGFRSIRPYHGPLQAVILDWAGTTVDYGSFAPTAVFLRLFASRGIPVTPAQVRTPMGLNKKDHLRAITQLPEVVQAWQAEYGRPCKEIDIEAMYAEFVPMQMACLTEYAEPIPGVFEAVAAFRRLGLKIGSTTGYTRDMMKVLVPEAARRGYEPDTWVCPEDVPAGRPYPWMIYLNSIRLQSYPLAGLVKIGDTVVDIEEGLNAGTWTIGLAISGNAMGMTREAVQALPKAELEQKRMAIAAEFHRVGAHFVVDDIWETPPVLEEIQRGLARGERP